MGSSLVVHLTSAHPRDDTRIFVKQCRSLAANGYRVSLVVADGEGNEGKEGVDIVDVGRLSGRVNRMLKTTRRVFREAVKLDGSIYHLHDPELIPIGLSLKRRGKKVIFDSHEDVSTQLLSKPYLGALTRRALSRGFSAYERHACRRFDGIVAATAFIRDKFLGINPTTIDVNNFPLIGELDSIVPWSMKRKEVCYIGTIGGIRGIKEMVRACEYLRSPARLVLAGRFYESEVEAEVKTYKGWERVDELGHLDRRGVRDVLAGAVAGLVTLHPTLHYLDAWPVKMFEYMAAGLPVIASNFPLWREILEGNDCGICVDPFDPHAIADAVDCLVGDPKRSSHMGQNGREAVLRKYNWATEERKLLKLYADIMAHA